MKSLLHKKLSWEKPVLTCYGEVTEITRSNDDPPDPPGKLPCNKDGNGNWPSGLDGCS